LGIRLQNRKFEKVSFGEYWSLLRQYLSPMKFRLLLLAVFMTLGNFLPLITPQILRFFIDTATDNLEASRDILRRERTRK